MQISGIVCEYNPLHLGHKKQINLLRESGHLVVCLMSGNFVQRGHPAVFDKMARAKAALASGADLVLELPVPYALSSAEGFAAGSVNILSKICHNLCFGAENADAAALMQMAKILLGKPFKEALRLQLEKGLSFPAARSAAIAAMGSDANLLDTPNNILAVEYCKAIVAQKSALKILPIHRPGSYHDHMPDPYNPSATAVRYCILHGENWHSYVPENCIPIMDKATRHDIRYGERGILAKLRSMGDAEFEALPFGTEGLWRKLMHASRQNACLEDIIHATKSKRYTRTRIDRMILCAFLGITAEDMDTPAPYCRVLAFNDNGRAILNSVRDSGFFLNIGEDTHYPFQDLERRCTSLYGLFSEEPEAPDAEEKYRVYYPR